MSDASTKKPTTRFVFPRWANYVLPLLFLGVLGGAFYAPTIVAFGFSPKTTDVGYAPVQPVHYSHALHAGQLGIDCRYCHNTVDKAGFAAIPATQVCMNCHTVVKANGPDGKPNAKLQALFDSWSNGTPVKWNKVHDLPDFAYFNHSAHVNKGVSCVSCHGRVDQMEVVHQSKPLSMSWCLDCHTNPENSLRPRDQVTNLAWKAIDDPIAKEKGITDPVLAQKAVGEFYKHKYEIRGSAYMTSCSTCHR